MTLCEACRNYEHAECLEPVATRMEHDTGYHIVLVCCCGMHDIFAAQSEAAIERAEVARDGY